jgi:Cu(I)/Ag(I) efflux system membrane fusion protein
MEFKKILNSKYLKFGLILIVGILIGRFVFSTSSNNSQKEKNENAKIKTIWTCSMHPQIRMDKPGLCPLCGMDLIPLNTNTSEIDSNAVAMTEEAIQLANISTLKVVKGYSIKETELYGKVTTDERLVKTIPSYISGRIEKLSINFTGEQIYKGQIIGKIYSPELINAQTEFIEALNMKPQQSILVNASRQKLKELKISDKQISEIENSKNAKTVFDIIATESGIVINKKVNEGDYVQSGTPLYEIADLSRVWVLFDAYESDIQWIKKGNNITFTVESYPGKEFTGKISFIDPVINSITRVAKVRVEVDNSDGLLKPEMFTKGKIKSEISKNIEQIIVPQSAVMWTGIRSIVYVKMPNSTEPVFKMREVILGELTQSGYIIVKGLSEGEEIVVNGTFSVDAAAQLAGKSSMMNSDETLSNFKIGNNLKSEILKITENYIHLKNSLILADNESSKKFAERINLGFSNIKIDISDKKSLELLNNQKQIIIEESAKIKNAKTIDLQRVSFKPLSQAFIKILKSYNISSQKFYIIFCPMADNNKGGFWLSKENKVKNPYYGSLMLECGSVKDSIY